MRRTATVETTNYVPGTWEKDEDGFGYRDGDDFSDTDWLSAFKDTYRTRKNSLTCSKKQPKNLPMARCLTSQNRFGKT